MAATEATLKQHIRARTFARVYLLYGEETYLTQFYAQHLAHKILGDDDLAAFNRVELDGQDSSVDTILDAIETMPLMANEKCVLVREWNVSAAPVHERFLSLINDFPDSTVLIMWYTHPLDTKKNAKWKTTLAAVESAGGICVDFPRCTQEELAKLLVNGASKRKCTLSLDAARGMVEQCGNAMDTLLNELDKLCAVAGEGGEITLPLIKQAATRQLSARVYDLTKTILKGRYDDSYRLLHCLFAAREDPIAILAVLSGGYVDLYRAKVAAISGVSAESLAAEWGYRGREFVLRNAARDCRKMELSVLRRCLDLLADADMRLKGSRVQPRVVLEQTVAQLIVLGKGGTV